MKVISVNLRNSFETLHWETHKVKTGINKLPVEGPVEINFEGLVGDSIADKKHHGGEFKAVYSYASEYYDFWRKNLERPDLPFGMLGENLTTQGLDEESVLIGERFQIGSVIIQATEPRQPCRVLGMNLQDMSMIKRFRNEGRMGIYFKVIQPGTLTVGDEIIRLGLPEGNSLPISEITRLYVREPQDIPALEKILQVPTLPPQWHDIFEKQLATAQKG